MLFCSRASRLTTAACLANIHRLSPHIVSAGLPFQVPKWDVNQAHLLLLLLLWLCNGQSQRPSGRKVARQESSINSVRCQSVAKKLRNEMAQVRVSEGGGAAVVNIAFGFRWMSAFKLRQVNPAKTNVYKEGCVTFHYLGLWVGVRLLQVVMAELIVWALTAYEQTVDQRKGQEVARRWEAVRDILKPVVHCLTTSAVAST